MKHRLICIILTLALALTLSGGALAAEEVRQTDFFAGVLHSQTDFADMEYRRIEPEPILALIDQARELLDDASNAARVEELYDQISGDFLELSTMRILIYIRACQDIWDEEAAAEYARCAEQEDLMNDAIRALARDILNSPCAAFLEERLGPDAAERFGQYEELTERQRELIAREISLAAKYNALAGQTYADADEKNKALGEFYLELTAVRREMADAYGYDSYADYAYEQTYSRDYTPEEIRSFHAAVKEYIAPLSNDLLKLRNAYRKVDEYKALLDGEYVEYAGDFTLDTIEPYLGRLSDELLESFQYLRRYHLYDMDPSETKAAMGYTIELPHYGAAFIFSFPYGEIYDFHTAIHEFGHYNRFYHTDWSWERSAAGESYDAAEVHSQGLEALFFHFYPEIFGELAPAVEIYKVDSLVASMVDGALHDEFQQYVYAAGDVLTLEMLNEKYYELCTEYGVLKDDGELTRDWVDIPHTFTSPCYFISYATSAAGALAVWEESQSDFYGAVDKYLAFAALEPPMGFVDRFAAVGMNNPIAPESVKALAETLYERLDIKGRRSELSKAGETVSRAALAQMLYDRSGENAVTASTFADVSPDAGYANAVAWAEEKGLVTGYGNGNFGPDDPVTREQAAVILYRWAGAAETNSDLTTYPDAGNVHDWAAEAMAWAVGAGLIAGGDGARLDPQGQTTRVGAAAMLLRTAWLET